MDPDADSQPTQQATQNVLDPRRLGKQNSGFSDDEISDIICLLLPYSQSARREVSRIALESSQHMVGREEAENVDLDYSLEDDAGNFGLGPHGVEEHAIALKLSAPIKSPSQGFLFGRNRNRCDITFVEDPYKRLSNVHFRIFINEYGVLMLEDQSTNGTVVDEMLLKSRAKQKSPAMRTLSSGSKISILMHKDSSDLVFLVRVPRRDGEYESAYRKNLGAYLKKLQAIAEREDQTISAGPDGKIDLFPREFLQPKPASSPQGQPKFKLPDGKPPQNGERIPKEWNGSDQYNRVGQIGKGAFAIVHKVTAKFDGKPYAAKELEKRRFVKNGILDQKVENEMKIMQNVQHPNIVRYIEHFDWDDRVFVIIMEYVPGGDLGALISGRGRLNEAAVRIMAKQLLDALGYLHQKNITHRDVKPDNILIQSQQPFVVKLTDFGLSKMVDNDQTFLRTFCGTLLYCAPEVYSEYADYDDYGKRNPRNRHRRAVVGQRYDHAIDVWSLGGVLFYALTESPPYPVKTGISYSELLQQIMTKPLDIIPLVKANVSADGIDFLSQMLQRRPEKRATVQDLLAHPWLADSEAVHSESADEISDDELQQEASQLSLTDHQNGQGVLSDDEILDDEGMSIEDQFGTYESQKENWTFGTVAQPRLFGEVNVSAIGSSGVIPEYRLNLPVTDSSLSETDILGSEVRDSYESEAYSTPMRQISQQKSQRPSSGGARLSADKSHSVDELNNLTFDVESQSLGGAESILENLNMKSWAAPNLRRSNSEFTTSKRKPASDASDEFDGAPLADKPMIKRLKSEGQTDSLSEGGDVAGENILYTLVPPVSRIQSGRQLDLPVHKSSYWTPGDTATWHLRYPEMTQLQYDAFESASKERGEEFRPGKSVLWGLAMKHFPPAEGSAEFDSFPDAVGGGAALEELELNFNGGTDEVPSTANQNDLESLPDTLPPETDYSVAMRAEVPRKRPVASLQSAPGSVVPGISVFVTESVTSWGRGVENTRVYSPKTESRVPKYACKILLWKEAFDPSKDLRPWNRPSTTDQSSYYFYISTKATNGIMVNDILVPSHDPKNPSSPSKHWIRLYDGDIVLSWRSADNMAHTRLTFQCNWGGSSKRRPKSTEAELPPPAFVPDAIAKRLDEACLKTEKRIAQRTEQELKMAEANHDVVERQKNIERERLRSIAFETKRLDVCRTLSIRGSRRVSPASATPGATTGLTNHDAASYGSPISAAASSPAGERTVLAVRRTSPTKKPLQAMANDY